jgi:hypothetical protein
MMRGALAEFVAVLWAVPIFLQSLIPHGHAVAGGFLLACFCLLGVGLVVQLAGYRKIALERVAGYTTLLGVAKQEPALAAVHPRTFRIVAGPFEPRPKRMPRT